MGLATFILVSQYTTTTIFLILLLHKLYQLVAFGLTQRKKPLPGNLPQNFPFVVVQVPVFNEVAVIQRSINAVCALVWPADRLRIHILDDSNDTTTEIANREASEWRKRGVDVHVIRRDDRVGYKGGALQNDIDNHTPEQAQFFAIFDADFCPDPNFLTTVIPYFYDQESRFRENVGFVQTRWDYLNSDLNILTKMQQIILGAHFFLEQPFRHRTGRVFNFNGTGGVWNRKAIEDAGGWQHDTVIEDSDLSYRTWIEADYRFIYLRNVHCLNELPTKMSDYRSQQKRWTKGFGQLLRKHAWKVFSSRKVTLSQKVEFLYHCISPISCIATVWLHMFYPLNVFTEVAVPWIWVGISVGCVLIFIVYYFAILWMIYDSFVGACKNFWKLPVLYILFSGLSVQLAYSMIEGIFSKDATFVRTPKRAEVTSVDPSFIPENRLAEATEETERQCHREPQCLAGEEGHYAGDLTKIDDALTSSSDEQARDLKEVTKSQSSYFTTKLSFVAIMELLLALWSIAFVVLAALTLFHIPLTTSFNQNVFWLSSIIVLMLFTFTGYVW
eukprot:CAMPEP_0184684616 /NCGR_PEP_ID=MMETSP0312-20130426/15979_1 /TAXON_ID=31354 /ORGANISM="Compsopogon coeruleus, Strain SAG 36.94" /LENGTH=556 /DNA_ID=CAMNT_0027137961 /DNA_START=149 /DNA_END=1816 /DNA_ORIENTATION=-